MIPWKKTKTGFTLIELMVSVALMLVLVGAVVMVFNHTSTVFNVSEAKMSIYQNARAALELMARELTSADNIALSNYSGGGGTPVYAGFDVSNNDIFQFKTNTFWITGSTRENGMAVVEYYLEAVSGNNNIRNLMRRVRRIDITASNTTLVEVSKGILGQYIPNVPNAFELVCFEYDSGTNQWEQYPSASAPTKTKPDIGKLPGAVRITIKFTDRESRIIRTLSRTVWIPKVSS
jgi:prepilin-type N-terminal cleavage/methylation domain-containing protein